MRRASNYIVSDTATLKEVITKINENFGKHLIVLNKKDKVVGVLGDGDVRRAVLRGALLSGPASDFMTTGFISVEEKDTKKLRELFVKHLITTIPIIHHNGRLHKIAIVIEPEYRIEILDYAK